MDVSKLHRITKAAQLLRINRSTLLAAIDREELPIYPTMCGLPLVRLEDVAAWKKADRRLGRPPKS